MRFLRSEIISVLVIMAALCACQRSPATPNEKPNEGFETLNFPSELLGRPLLFGGTITKISDERNAALGALKLLRLEPQIIRIDIKEEKRSWRKPADKFLVLSKCSLDCSTSDPKTELFRFPVFIVKNSITIRTTSIADSMDLVQLLTDKFIATISTKLNPKTAARLSEFTFDTGLWTLDVFTDRLLPANSVLKRTETSFSVTSQWYFKVLEKNRSFVPRSSTEGVGYFTTDTVKPKILRFDFSGGDPISYSVKGVPANRQKAFADAFENWNRVFVSLSGKKVFRYEFVDESMPSFEKLYAGNPRYNVVEWDLQNRADYGGKGPIVANPATGEIYSAAVSIQGPSAEEKYRRLFANQAALSLPWNQFPKNVDFNEYMNAYFTEMLTHELGHNLGLRHNFKGSLGFSQNTVSRSVMDYLNPELRHRMQIGEYDVQAIDYGYFGRAPKETRWYCGDDESVNMNRLGASAECNPNDATDDPFGYFESQLEQIVLALTDPLHETNFFEAEDEYLKVLTGLAAYAKSAAEHSSHWTQFSTPERPRDPAKIRNYVVARIQQRVCSEAIRSTAHTHFQSTENLKNLESAAHSILLKVDPSLQNACVE